MSNFLSATSQVSRSPSPHAVSQDVHAFVQVYSKIATAGLFAGGWWPWKGDEGVRSVCIAYRNNIHTYLHVVLLATSHVPDAVCGTGPTLATSLYSWISTAGESGEADSRPGLVNHTWMVSFGHGGPPCDIPETSRQRH